MDFRTSLQQVNVLLDHRVHVTEQNSKPSHLFASLDGSRIYSTRPQDVPVLTDEAFLKIYFSRLALVLKKYSYHTRILFKASQNPEGPLSQPLTKALQILIWGGVKPKYRDPALQLLQSPMDRIHALLEDQEKAWKELESVISWDQFLLICQKLDKEKDICRAAYIALSFKNPTIQTLNRFKLYLRKTNVIEQAPNLIKMLASRICMKISTLHEKTAIQLIMKEVPTHDCTPYPSNGTFIADFKSETLFYSLIDPCQKGKWTVSPIYSPTHSILGLDKPSLSLWSSSNWPFVNADAYRVLGGSCKEVELFRQLPPHLQTDGIRLIRMAQKKGYLSKGDQLSDFNRLDLMALHFLYYSTELDPKEKYYVEEGESFSVVKENPLVQMGNAVRAYFEHDLYYLIFQFERGVESGEIIYWEKKKEGFPEMKKVEVIDPLTFLMKDLIKSVEWVNGLFFMEKVNQLMQCEN